MRRLTVFNAMSLDGFIADSTGDMSWAHRQDQEWDSFVRGNANGEGVLVFGRKTYDMMAGYWPTPMAAENAPAVRKRMNELQKIVFSQTMEKALWQNTTLLKGHLEEEVQRLKQQPGPDLVILGGASIVAQLSDARLIDEYQVALAHDSSWRRQVHVRRYPGKAPAQARRHAQLREWNRLSDLSSGVKT